MTLLPRFIFPMALILLMLIPWSIWLGARIRSLSGGRKWTAITLRSIILLCLVGALAGAELVRTENNLAVFFLLDHSNSVDEEARLASAQWIRDVSEEYMTERDKAGVIVFGEDASIELNADSSLGLREIMSYVGGEQTNLAAAMRLAMAAFPQGHMKRMVIFSDGNETRGSALEEAKLARADGVAVDVVPLRIGGREEVRIREVSTPSRVNVGEPFQLRVVAHAEQDSDATIRIFQRRGDDRRLLAPQQVTLQKGDNTFVLSQELTRAGFYEYEVILESDSDTVVANNQGRAFTHVQGEATVLFVDSDPERSTYLIEALRNEGVQVEAGDPGTLPTSLAQFQNYDAVILSDISSTAISSSQLKLLEAMVRDMGIGLIMIGGPDGFGAGGYLDTPVEKALPVDMDIKQRKVLPRGALAVVLHTCEFANGNQWAAEIAMAALNVLSPQDLMGVMGYMWDDGNVWIYPLQAVNDKKMMRQRIRQASPRIGDMPSVAPTLQMAYNALKGADAAAKRIIIISDGDPSPPSLALLNSITAAGIAISTVCINPHSPQDQGMLRAIAERTGGQFYFVTNPNNLPQIFTKEAAIVKRGLLMETPFTPKFNHDSELLFGLEDGNIPELQGYVVTSAKENATVPLVSTEGDPILAHWRYGLGKSVAFTSDVKNRWATEWLNWDGFSRFWAQTVRWATREITPTNFRVDTAVKDGMGHIRVDAVDEAGQFINFLQPRGVVTGPAPDFVEMKLELSQTGPGIYEASFPLSESGVYMMNLLYTREDGTVGTMPAGLALGYSREYEYTTTNVPLLEQLATVGGGLMREEKSNPFVHDLVATPSVYPIWHILAMIAVCLFPLEIFVRRVVVPFAAIYALIARALRRLPALGKLIPRPALRPAPVTGSYSAVASVERDFTTSDGPMVSAFGDQVAEVRQALTVEEEESAEETQEAAPKIGHSDYTRQLLAAKDRAIARKQRRLGGFKDDTDA